MSYLIAFLGFLGFDTGTWPVWGVLLLTLVLAVTSVLLVLISWILITRATRAGWNAQSETSQAKSRAYNDALTASRLSHECAKAEATQAADLTRIRAESQAVVDGPNREIAALRKALDEHRQALGERDAAIVQLREANMRVQEQMAHLNGKIEAMSRARAAILGEADDHRIERQQLTIELAGVRQQLAQAQAESERLHGSLREAISRIPTVVN